MSLLISFLLSFWLETGSVILDLCLLTLGVNLSSYSLSRFLTRPLIASYSGGITSVLNNLIVRHRIFEFFLTIISLNYIGIYGISHNQYISIRDIYTVDLSFFITFEICFTQILGLREKIFSKFIEYHNNKISQIGYLQNKISLSKKVFNFNPHQKQAFAVFKLKEFESNLTKEMWLSELAVFIATHLTGNLVHIDLEKFQINFFLFESTSLMNIIYFYSLYSRQAVWNKFQIHIKNLEIKVAEAKLLSRKLNEIFQKFIGVNSVCRFILKRESLQHTQAIVEFNFIGFNENLKKEIIKMLELGSMFNVLGYEEKSNMTLHLLPVTKQISWAAGKFKEQVKVLFPELRKPAPFISYGMIYLTEPQQILYQTRHYPKKKSKKIKLESKEIKKNRHFGPPQQPISPVFPINFQRYGVYLPNNPECGIRIFPDGDLPNVFVKLNADLDSKLTSLGRKGNKILLWFRGRDDEKKDKPPVFERNYTECLPNGKVAFFKVKAGKEERLVSTSCVKLSSPCSSLVYTLFAFDHCEILHGLTTYRYKPKAEQIDRLSGLP